MNREVYVVGVGMHPFTKEYVPVRDMYFTAGVAALEDAGCLAMALVTPCKMP